MSLPRTAFYEELLHFYDIAGVDTAVSEKPINNFSMIEEKPVLQQVKQTTQTCRRLPLRHIHDAVDVVQVANARETVHNTRSLEELKMQLEAFDGCHLKLTAKNTCFSDGVPGSALMLIGEAPGRDEDVQALPFVGRSGQLLNQMLAAIGLNREQVYITNVVPWRPPGNRAPTSMEIELCRPFIDRQIELAHPRILIALGGLAAKSLTGSREGILRLRGNWYVHRTMGGIDIPVMPTLHPAYLLRTPSHKRFAWDDFLTVKMNLKNKETKKALQA